MRGLNSALLLTGSFMGKVSCLAPNHNLLAQEHGKASPATPNQIPPAKAAELVASSDEPDALRSATNRRFWIKNSVVAISAFGAAQLLGLSAAPHPALASTTPMVTTDEFLIILRDSARSIQVVEFSGPKSETATVKLVDGTAFGIKDVIESPTDPRSPLRIAAYCRENQVPTRFLTIEAALAKAPRRTKVYTNQRVAEANEREKERVARMAADEQARREELNRMQEAEQASTRSSVGN
jgi:hypothetical protein